MTETGNSVTRRGWYRLVTAAALCAAAVTLVVFLSRRDRPNDETRIQGVWVSDKPSRRLTVTGYLVVEEGFFDEPSHMFFRLEPGASPKRIIECPADRPTRPQWFIPLVGMEFGPPVASHPDFEGHGIYELEGDRLRICYPEALGLDFPKSFDPTTVEYHRP